MMSRGIKSNIVWNRWLSNQSTNDSLIAGLDPLGIDLDISLLPELNKLRDVKSIIKLLYKNLPYPDMLEKLDYNESLACMRDIGFFLGSIKRHGIEPVEVVPELDYILDVLGAKTNLPPRDTLMHYTIWNPQGRRQRTYTHFNDEKDLIASVQMSYRPLGSAIHNLVELHQTEFENPAYIDLCGETAETFKKVVGAIVHAKKSVSPEVFANELRFYFDPILLHNNQVIGPGAVEMPMFVYDHLLWSCDVDDEPYTKFKSTYLPFSEPDTRDIYYDYLAKPSLITKMRTALEQYKKPSIINSAKALYGLCKSQMSFRMPHKKLADKSYSHGEKDETKEKRAKGSGGYSTSILSDIINLNVHQIRLLHDSIHQ
jgi:monodechloroaminopyrrolnitrin synthase